MQPTIYYSPSAFPPVNYESLPSDFIRVASGSIANSTATEVSQQFSSFLILNLFSKNQTVPLINCKRGDLSRCGTCNAFLSPFVQVNGDYRCWRCPLCRHINSTIMFTSLYDMTVAFDRPELHSLVYDIQPPKELLFVNGRHRAFLFMIDEWILSNKSTSFNSLLSQLDAVEKVIRPTDLISLIIYSETITLFDLKQMKARSFLDFDPSLYPHAANYYVTAEEGFVNLKKSIKSFGHNKEFTHTKVYPSILWACHLMKKIGGRLLLFSTGRNTFTENEENEQITKDLFKLIQSRSISISLFKAGPLRTVENWAIRTGGIIAPLGQTPPLLNLFIVETAWNSALSIRTSTNVKNTAIYGNGWVLDNGVFQFPVATSQQSYVFELETTTPAHVQSKDGIPDNFYFQFAIRFTDDNGLRKIRIINGMLPFSDVLKFPLDEAAISLFLLRKRIAESREKTFNSRVVLTRNLIDPNATSQLPILLYGGTIMDSQFLNDVSVQRFVLAIHRTQFVFPSPDSNDQKRVLTVLWTHSLTVVWPQPTPEEQQIITDAAFELGIAPTSFFTPKDHLEFESMVNNDREAKRWYSEVTGYIPQ